MAHRRRSRIASRRPMSARPARARSCSTCWLSRSTRRTSRCAAAITGCGRPCRRPRARNVSAGSPRLGSGSAASSPVISSSICSARTGRSDEVAAELKALGADVVLVDGDDLAARAHDAVGGAPIRLGIDAVSGTACKRIADSVADGAVVVSYGAMSGEDLVMSRPALSFRGVSLTGFNLGRGLAKRSPQQVRALYADLAIKLRDGVLKAPIEATYPIEDIKQALTHAQRGGRNGKVLVLPNGRLGAS